MRMLNSAVKLRLCWWSQTWFVHSSEVLVNSTECLTGDGLTLVNEMLQTDQPSPEKTMVAVMDELATSCGRYLSLNQSRSGMSSEKTKLDKERLKLCQREMVSELVGSRVEELEEMKTSWLVQKNRLWIWTSIQFGFVNRKSRAHDCYI